MQAALRCAARSLLASSALAAHTSVGAAPAGRDAFAQALGTSAAALHRSHFVHCAGPAPFSAGFCPPPPRTAHRAAAARMATQQSWQGEASQEELMLKDECILVDESDAIVGHASKRAAHRFVAGQPHGLLHRAFSVFLFDSRGRLLLQQRAASKITFPGVWTNTCCSHPLYGQDPPEVDSPADVASGAVPGAKRAALRKLRHELGIHDPSALSPSHLTFLTRLHYCAADSGPRAQGQEAEWGEHEVDYVLVAQADVEVHPNPEEVGAVRYVTQEELRAMMAPGSGLSWSPWFRIIAQRWLEGWWADLQGALQGAPRHVDTQRVHRVET